jgi:hypothetical protein
MNYFYHSMNSNNFQTLKLLIYNKNKNFHKIFIEFLFFIVKIFLPGD